jgi:hypothetical protein
LEIDAMPRQNDLPHADSRAPVARSRSSVIRLFILAVLSVAGAAQPIAAQEPPPEGYLRGGSRGGQPRQFGREEIWRGELPEQQRPMTRENYDPRDGGDRQSDRYYPADRYGGQYEAGEYGPDAEPYDEEGHFPPYDDDGYYGDWGWRPCCCWFDCQRFWARGEYLMWWTKGLFFPPLITTSTDGTAQADAGVLGLASTSILAGAESVGREMRSGGRVRLGYWVDDCDSIGIEGSYFRLQSLSNGFSPSSVDTPILARPFTNLDPASPGEQAELVAFPGVLSGSIAVNTCSSFQGADVLLRKAVIQDCWYRVDCLAGWRYNRLSESIVISDSKTVLSTDGDLAIGTMITEFDKFSATNSFNGAAIGTSASMCRGCWWVETRAVLALGDNRTRVNVSGQATSTTPSAGGTSVVTTTPAGLLAQPSNIGNHTADIFAIVPEFGASLGWDITCRLRATIGYSLIYWNKVMRPGDQIDLHINPSQIAPGGLVGVAAPRFPAVTSDFWAQGLNVGLAYRF